MTYEKLFALKYKDGVSTSELTRRFPEEIKRVSEIALLDIPESMLKRIIREEKTFHRLIRLKKKFLKAE